MLRIPKRERHTAAIFDVLIFWKSKFDTSENHIQLWMRPIDAITDLANELMLESQPLHTLILINWLQINGGENIKWTVRKAFENEELELWMHWKN